jgi:hypothetical protein
MILVRRSVMEVPSPSGSCSSPLIPVGPPAFPSEALSSIHDDRWLEFPPRWLSFEHRRDQFKSRQLRGAPRWLRSATLVEELDDRSFWFETLLPNHDDRKLRWAGAHLGGRAGRFFGRLSSRNLIASRFDHRSSNSNHRVSPRSWRCSNRSHRRARSAKRPSSIDQRDRPFADRPGDFSDASSNRFNRLPPRPHSTGTPSNSRGNSSRARW